MGPTAPVAAAILLAAAPVVAQEVPAPDAWDADAAEIERVDPPEQGFYAKRLTYRGVPIESAAVVEDEALREASRRLDRMLRDAPGIVANLVAEGAELHVIGRDQGTSDLPEHRHWKGRAYEGDLTIDERTRGVGGLFSSCGEENLLGLEGDRYADRDICTHEFAHTVLRFGLDQGMQERVREAYRASLRAGRWAGAYASKNEDEWFAELSMWFFGSRGDYGPIEPRPEPGRAWLERYDPEGAALLAGLYSGAIAPGVVARVRLAPVTPREVSALRSVESTVRVSLVLVNTTDEPLEMWWVDFAGERRPFGTLPAGGAASQGTYATHPWVLTSGDEVRAAFVPGPEACRAVVRPPAERDG